MYIPVWLIVVAIVFIFFYISKKRVSGTIQDEEERPEWLWERGYYWKRIVNEESVVMGGKSTSIIEYLDAMEKDSLRLKERFKHDSKKQFEIAKDWYDFAEASSDAKHSIEMSIVAYDDESEKDASESMDAARIVVQEISTRVINELGEVSQLKLIRNKYEKSDV